MDLSACIRILSTRQKLSSEESNDKSHTACPCYRNNLTSIICDGKAIKAFECDSTALTTMTPIELMNLFTTLQGERVQVYSHVHSFWFIRIFVIHALKYWILPVQAYSGFNNGLKVLIADNRLQDYSSLCAEATSIFSVISKQIIHIKVRIFNLLCHFLWFISCIFKTNLNNSRM